MAFPFLMEEGFELGTRGGFDATSDSNAKLTFPHYSNLARLPGLPAPYRGAYCMMIDLAGGTADAYVQETGAFDTNAAATVWCRFYVWFGAKRGETVVMADTDIFSILQLWSSTNTVEGSIGIQYTTANGYRFCVSELASGASGTFVPCELNKWHCVELKALVDSGVGNDGTLDLYIDGMHATQITGLDQGAITSAVMGALNIDAGTTRGVLLFDELVVDDAQVYPFAERFPTEILVTASEHVFVGPGCVANVSLLSGGATDNVVSVFDTDTAQSLDASNLKVELKNTVASELVDPAGMPVEIIRGCYVKLAGTNPRALVSIGRAQAYHSDGAVRNYGLRRLPHPLSTV